VFSSLLCYVVKGLTFEGENNGKEEEYSVSVKESSCFDLAVLFLQNILEPRGEKNNEQQEKEYSCGFGRCRIYVKFVITGFRE